MQQNKSKTVPLLIILFITIVSVVILYFTLTDEQKKNITNVFFGQEETTEEPTKVVHSIEEILNIANEEMLNKKYIYCKIYVKKVTFNNNISDWAYNFNDNIYMTKENDYIDFNENIHYFVNNGIWYKENIDYKSDMNLNNYTIPKTAKQVDDDKIDGALCYVFFNESTNKYYYIKQSTETIAYIKEVKDGVDYYYSFFNTKISIDHKIKRSALEK